MAIVDEIMQRMREMYSANHGIGDIALGSVMQFVYRKLRWEGAPESCCTWCCVTVDAAVFVVLVVGVPPSLFCPFLR